MPFGIGWAELLLIFIIVLLLFGAKRLPEIAQGLGKGIREFKRSMKDTTEEIKGSLDNEGTRDYNRAKQGGPDRGRDYDRDRDRDRDRDYDRDRDRDRNYDRDRGADRGPEAPRDARDAGPDRRPEDRRDDRPEERR